MVARVTKIVLKADGETAGLPAKPDMQGMSRYLDILQKEGQSKAASPEGARDEGPSKPQDDAKLRESLEAEIRHRQQATESLRQAEEEIKALQEKLEQAMQDERPETAEGEGRPNGLTLEEELQAKEAELNRIKMDYATKMKNSLALQRINFGKRSEFPWRDFERRITRQPLQSQRPPRMFSHLLNKRQNPQSLFITD